jgi:hypothetical protein
MSPNLTTISIEHVFSKSELVSHDELVVSLYVCVLVILPISIQSSVGW